MDRYSAHAQLFVDPVGKRVLLDADPFCATPRHEPRLITVDQKPRHERKLLLFEKSQHWIVFNTRVKKIHICYHWISFTKLVISLHKRSSHTAEQKLCKMIIFFLSQVTTPRIITVWVNVPVDSLIHTKSKLKQHLYHIIHSPYFIQAKLEIQKKQDGHTWVIPKDQIEPWFGTWIEHLQMRWHFRFIKRVISAIPYQINTRRTGFVYSVKSENIPLISLRIPRSSDVVFDTLPLLLLPREKHIVPRSKTVDIHITSRGIAI